MSERIIPFHTAREYLAIKEEMEDLQKGLKERRKKIMEYIQKNGSFIVDGREFLIEKRESYEYDPTMASTILQDFYPAVVKTVVDKKKIEGLLKGGLIKKEDVKQIKRITRVTEALVIKE